MVMKFRNQEYYERVKNLPSDSMKPFFNKSNCLVYISVIMLSVAVAPFLTIRKTHIVPSSLDIYFHQVMFSGWAVALISIPLLWFMQFKPYFEMKDGHHYVGKFKIVNKKQVLGYCFLSLFPGKRNWIKV